MRISSLRILMYQAYRKKQHMLSWIVNPVALATTSPSVLTVDTWNFTIIPAATATIPTVRQSWKNFGLQAACGSHWFSLFSRSVYGSSWTEPFDLWESETSVFSVTQMLLWNTSWTRKRQEVSWSNTRHHSGSAHLGTNTKLSSSHSLHCFRRWSVRRPKTSQMWRKVLYSSSRNGKSISWKVSLLSAKVLCHRQTCFLVFLCRTSEFLLLEWVPWFSLQDGLVSVHQRDL